MYLCDLTYRSPALADDPIGAAQDLAECLVRNGQFVGDHVVGIVDQDVRICGSLPLADSLDARYHSDYVRERLAVLERMSGEPPEIAIHPPDLEREPVHLSTLDDIRVLILRTRHEQIASPLWDPECDQHLPLHLVPLSADDRERVVLWERVQKTLDHAWFHGPTERIELDAYRERARFDSRQISEGREHARKIEDALGVPVYTWLERHYGAPEGDDERRCPSCGAAWLVEPASDGNGTAPFRCERCRLASHRAHTTEAAEWARFRPVS
ncbi:MAG: DUF2310 family Zn-ribbon-containing protein [Planctomycetota bacterium]